MSGLRFKMVLFFMAVVLIPLLAGAVWAFMGVKNQMVEAVVARNYMTSSNLSENVDQIIKVRVELVRTLAQIPNIVKMEPTELKHLLKSIKEKNDGR